MNELEDALNSVLSDPAMMERVSRLASEFLGGGAPGTQGTSPGDKAALLQAMAPYLTPARQARLKKALGLARMARLARAALEEEEGGGDV